MSLGTCGNCGGRIIMDMYTTRPKPYCESCGARPKEAFGPVREMEPPRDNFRDFPRESLQEDFGKKKEQP